jgi:hypothetical protein
LSSSLRRRWCARRSAARDPSPDAAKSASRASRATKASATSRADVPAGAAATGGQSAASSSRTVAGVTAGALADTAELVSHTSGDERPKKKKRADAEEDEEFGVDDDEPISGASGLGRTEGKGEFFRVLASQLAGSNLTRAEQIKRLKDMGVRHGLPTLVDILVAICGGTDEANLGVTCQTMIEVEARRLSEFKALMLKYFNSENPDYCVLNIKDSIINAYKAVYKTAQSNNDIDALLRQNRLQLARLSKALNELKTTVVAHAQEGATATNASKAALTTAKDVGVAFS